MTGNMNHTARTNELRRRAEEMVRKEDASVQESLSPEQMQYLIHELRVHQIELEMQNEELRRTQHELESSRTRCFDLYDQAPVGYLTLDEQGQILEANLTAAAMLGAERDMLIKQSLSGYIPPDDQDVFYLFCKQLTKTVASETCQLRILKKDGTQFWTKIEAIASHDKENGKPVLRVVIIDIQDRKQQEEALQNARNELEQRVNERTSALAAANEQMKRVSFELVWAEERERDRIAGELHDRVGQSLLLAKMKIDELADRILSDSLRTSAEEARTLLENSIKDIRSLTFKMRPPILDTAGIETALEWLCTSVSSDYALKIEFENDNLPKPLPAELRYSLYQAVRELLLNVVKHSRAEKAQLLLKTEKRSLVVQVMDNGLGFNYPEVIMKLVNNGGYGLYNVKQRVEQMGGRFVVESALGKGTKVVLEVPFRER